MIGALAPQVSFTNDRADQGIPVPGRTLINALEPEIARYRTRR